MRMIEYARRELSREDGEVGCVVSNGRCEFDYRGLVDASEENAHNPGIKITSDEPIEDLIHRLEFASDAKNNPSFMKGYEATLRIEETDWKIMAFQPVALGLKIHFVSEKNYNIWYDESTKDEPEYHEMLLLKYNNLQCNFTLYFTVERSNGKGSTRYKVEVARRGRIDANEVIITEYGEDSERIMSFTGDRQFESYEADRMFVQETVYIY